MSYSIEEIQDEHDEMVKRIYKILDTLEQRITKLEKVSGSHAKCIGEIREKESKISNFILP